jgi:protein TonB
MHEVADPVAVARVKGRGSFRGARALPVGSVNPKPKYPYSARKRGYEGRVVLHVQVSANGEPLDVSVVHSTGYRALDAAARSAVLHWRFEAARRAGVRIAGMVVTPIVFKLEN